MTISPPVEGALFRHQLRPLSHRCKTREAQWQWRHLKRCAGSYGRWAMLLILSAAQYSMIWRTMNIGKVWTAAAAVVPHGTGTGEGTETPWYPFNFSACLLLKDANIILPEWLAYHYTILPLRRLIVGLDPSSLTDPRPILDLYRDLGMDISVWTNETFIFDGRSSHEKRNFLTPNSTDEDRFKFYRWRQACFYTECLRQLKKENRTWTAVVDADEYVGFNYYDPNEGPPWWCKNRQDQYPNVTQCELEYVNDIRTKKHPRSKLPLLETGVTAAAHIASGVDFMYDASEPACIVFSRITVGAKESNPDDVKRGVPDGFDPMLFHTLRYRKREVLQNSLPGKSFVDVSRYDGRVVANPHRPIVRKCRNGPFVKNAEGSYRVYHYTGSIESFLRPGYDSRGKATFEKRQKYEVGGEDDTLRPWLARFVKLVGKETALEVTEKVRRHATQEMQHLIEEAKKSKE